MVLNINVKAYDNNILDALREITRFQADIMFYPVKETLKAQLIIQHNIQETTELPNSIIMSGRCDGTSNGFTVLIYTETRMQLNFCICRLNSLKSIQKPSARFSPNNENYMTTPILNKMVWEMICFAKNVAKWEFETFRGFPICLTFDVDHLTTSLRYRISRLAIILFHKQPRNLKTWKKVVGYTRSKTFQHKDTIMLLNKYKIKSTWFIFMRTRKSSIRFEGCLNPIYWPRETVTLINDLDKEEHEIGLHASPFAAKAPKMLNLEKRLLENLTKQEVVGVRVHSGKHKGLKYLKSAQNFFRYDASDLSNRGNGFLLGFSGTVTCHNFVRIPAHWMDTAMTNFKVNSWEEAFQNLEESANQCAAIRAPLVIILHNKPKEEFSLELLENFIKNVSLVGGHFITMKDLLNEWLP